MLKANPGKKITITFGEKNYARIPIATHIISQGDDIVAAIKKYTKGILKKGDIVVISERIVAISQGRSFLLDKIHPSSWARLLSRFVAKHPGGIGLKSPHAMELAIGEAGLARIIFAAVVSAVFKPFGIKGLFYQIVGHDVNAIDGPTEYSLPPSNRSVKLGPKNAPEVCENIFRELKAQTVIIDANDYGVRVMGKTGAVDKRMIEKIFSDNPLGQARQQTPIAIVREV